jgi:hypothetical protein
MSWCFSYTLDGAQNNKTNSATVLLLLKDNLLFHDSDKPSFENHINKLISKVKLGDSNRQVMSLVGVHFGVAEDNGIIEYPNKRMKKYGLDTEGFIGVLGTDGTYKISPAKY